MTSTFDCEAAVKSNPDFHAALLQRGITDPDLVMVDPWSVGNYGAEDEQGDRFSRFSNTGNILRQNPVL
jgi:primary-amine oxidase